MFGKGGIVVDDIGKFLEDIRIDDWIKLKDARKKKRELIVVETFESGFACNLFKTTYFESGMKLSLFREKKNGKKEKLCSGFVGSLITPMPVELFKGCDLTLVSSEGNAARREVPVDLSGAILKPGDRVMLDDGCCTAIVRGVNEVGHVHCVVQSLPQAGWKLKAEKGINVPDAIFPKDVKALTEMDRKNLADFLNFYDRNRPLTLGLSFVRRPKDIKLMRECLKEHGLQDKVSICAKIETVQALGDLPSILLACLECVSASIMLARGDLASEAGFERLASATDDLIVMCSAAGFKKKRQKTQKNLIFFQKEFLSFTQHRYWKI